MDDVVNTENNILLKMGATGNPHTERLTFLQERKKTIEDSLAKFNQELKQLCLQEADLTGTIPAEMPLEPGESPPMIRRRVGTTYQLPENLIKNVNHKDETVTDLELQIQLHANMAEAALELANQQSISKTLRRQHLADYQDHKHKLTNLQDMLTTLKDKTQQQQQIEQMHKQKKKPRPSDQDDNVSMSTSSAEPFVKSDLRHSLRSLKAPTEGEMAEQRYTMPYPKMAYKNTSTSYLESTSPRQHEETLARGLYRLSINGYKNYMESCRQESMANSHISSSYNTLQYSHHTSHMQINQHSQLSPHYQPQPPQMYQRQSQTIFNYPPNYHQVQQMLKSQSSPTNFINSRLQHRQSSPNTNSPKIFYPPNPEHNHNHNYRVFSEIEQTFHPHQIQPHQQYEHTAGLGGYWKRLESGDLVWCNSSPIDSSWQRDKRFGSLDRRKNKRIHKRVSTSVDPKSATLATTSASYSEHVRTASIKSPQVITRRSQDNRQLVRTQSLGSVGAQTIDSVWPSDDNSSCESDNRSINEAGQGVRKQKQKEWVETSLDGPVSPTHSVISRSHSTLPSVLSPEEKYISPPVPPPLTPKPPLEIPAESNPSPRLPETNLELFNNNIPKNCTVVQAGHCKPYHEETKPFEMADYYKYSTKFKKSPVKPQEKTLQATNANFQRNLNETFDKANVKNHNFSPTQLSPARLDNTNSLNSSLDLSQISNANVAERFSDEMNTWYKNHKLQIDSSGSGSTSKGKSTATLV